MTNFLTDIASRLRDALVYDADNIVNLRNAILNVRDRAVTALEHSQSVQACTPQRFAVCLTTDGHRNIDTGEWRPEEQRVLYFIGGLCTLSKIQAIKEVRTVDGSGLKEAKDLVDALQGNAKVLRGFGASERLW